MDTVDNYFTVSPMSERISLKPGETYQGKIAIINPIGAKEDFNYKVTVQPYSVIGEKYNADLTSESNYTQIVKWITIEDTKGTVKPNGIKEIHYTITVPENAPGGSQFAAIVIGQDQDNAPRGDGVAVNNIFEIASLIYGNVDGETKHEGEILANNVPAFVASSPITLSSLLSNNGNVLEDATYLITAKNSFTGEVILSGESKDDYFTELVMPETTRSIERDITELPALGVVHVEQTIYYNGHYSKEAKDVIVCPIWFLVLVILAIAALITTIVLIIRKHKKHKKQKYQVI